MSRKRGNSEARKPQRQRGKQRVAELLEAATTVFAAKGFEAATMTEIAARAGAPIGSLYQFFPTKEALADSLIERYIAIMQQDRSQLAAAAKDMSTPDLVDRLFRLLRGHPHERAAALPLAEARMDERTRRSRFRNMVRQWIATILRARAPRLAPARARAMAIVMLQLIKAVSALGDEDALPGRSAAVRDLRALAIAYLS